MKVALYARVSKEEKSSKGKFQNPENQLNPLRKYVNAMEWNLQDEYIDYASGGDSNRPEFRRLLKEVRQRHVDLVLVWALDRFSREGIVNTMSYIKTLKQYNTHLKSLQEGWLDTRNEGITELILSIMSWAAAEEKRKISERTKAGLARSKKKGGRPPKCNACGLQLWGNKKELCSCKKRPPEKNEVSL